MAEPIPKLASKLAAKPFPFADVVERFGLATWSKRSFKQIFEGSVPATAYVREGSLKTPKELVFGAASATTTLYVIDGDLEVDRMFDYSVTRGSCVLHVTGKVRAKSVALDDLAHLWIGRSLEAREYLLLNLVKTGSLIVRGATSAETVIACRAGSYQLASPPVGRVIAAPKTFAGAEPLEPTLRAPFHDPDEFPRMVEAIEKGRSVTREPKR